jgi:transcriptional regulator with XRE-family HTH domain
MAQSAISRIERNAVSPSVDTLGRIFEAMGETVSIRAVPLSEPLPEAGNQSIAELRRSGRLLTPEERLLEAVELSEAATRLAAQA